MDVELTELEKIDATRVDGVGVPANGIPILLMKSVELPAAEPEAEPEPELDRDAAKALAKAILADLTASPGELFKAVGKRGQVDEAPDIDLGNQIIALLGQAIAAEAQEVAAGNAGEVCDIQELACALQAVRCWRDGEQAVSLGDVMPASMLMQSAAEDDYRKRMDELTELDKIEADRLRAERAEKGGDAPGDGSKPYGNVTYADPGYQSDKQKRYPLDTEKHIRAAWSYINQDDNASKYSPDDLASVKSKIRAAMKRIGADTEDTAKSQIAPEVTTVDTVTQETGGLSKAVEDAIAKANAPLLKEITDLKAELAKVKAAPVPSGLVLSRNVQVKTPGSGAANEDLLAKAAYYRQKAADAVAPVDRESYLALARETEQAARTKSA